MPREEAYAVTGSDQGREAAAKEMVAPLPPGLCLPGASKRSSVASDNEPLVPLPGGLPPTEHGLSHTPALEEETSVELVTSKPVRRRADTVAQLSLYECLGKNELLTSGPTRALHSVWTQLDEDGSGTLSKAEFETVNKILAVRWDSDKAWADAVLIQTMRDVDARFQWQTAHQNTGQEVTPEPKVLASEKQEQEISFRAFVSVYNQRIGTIRRHARRDIKKSFESWMHDPRGLLVSELDKFIRRVEKSLFLLAPRYSQKEDLELIAQLSNIQQVHEGTFFDFLSFERWWKYRAGLLEAETPVVPEFFEYKMNEMSLASRAKQERQRHKLLSVLPSTFSLRLRGRMKAFDTRDLVNNKRVQRPAKELWQLLSTRMRLLITMRREWGKLDDVYGHHESDFNSTPLQWYIRDPTSTFSTWWDFVQVAFLLYVTWTVPLRACFGIEVEIPSVAWVFDTVVDVYFLCDLFLNFITAYYDSTGFREGRPSRIAKRYLFGWFTVDFLSCIPVNYITMALENDFAGSEAADQGDGENLRAFKVLRLFRLSKMLRLARIKRIMAKYEDLEFVQNYAGMLGLGFVIVFMAHILACLWYTIGLDDSHFSPDGRPEPGWVLKLLCEDMCKTSNWQPAETGLMPARCDEFSSSLACPANRCRWGIDSSLPATGYDGLTLPHTKGNTVDACIPKKFCVVGCEMHSSVSLTWRYITSMCLVFGSLDPIYKTLPERTFAIFAYVVMVIIDGSVAGVLASVMVRMGGKDQEVNDRLSAAKIWMKEQRIPKAQASKALDYFRLVYKSRVMSQESEILGTMPPNMRLEFCSQLYTKYLQNVPVFRGLPMPLLHSISAIVEPMLAVRDQQIYVEDSSGKEMYILLEGELEVTTKGERLGFLGDGAFFGETPILDSSAAAEVRRRTVTAMVDSKLCYIHKDNVLRIAEKYPELVLRLKRCCYAGERVNKKGKKFLEAMEAAGLNKTETKKTTAEEALKSVFGAGFPVGDSSEAKSTAATNAISVDSTTEGDLAVDLCALSEKVDRNFAAHDAMLRTVIKNQQQLLLAVEQLQTQQTHPAMP